MRLILLGVLVAYAAACAPSRPPQPKPVKCKSHTVTEYKCNQWGCWPWKERVKTDCPKPKKDRKN